MKIKCPICKKVVGCTVPHCGDGSGVMVRRHKQFGVQCHGSWNVLPAHEVEESPQNTKTSGFTYGNSRKPKLEKSAVIDKL